MVDHTKPQTLNPIPVGTRVLALRAELAPGLIGATGVVVLPYKQWHVQTLEGQDLSLWSYGVALDRFPAAPCCECWAFLHGSIVPIAPPDEVVIDEQIEVTA